MNRYARGASSTSMENGNCDRNFTNRGVRHSCVACTRSAVLDKTTVPSEGVVPGLGLWIVPGMIVSIVSPHSKINRSSGYWTRLLLFCARAHNVVVDLVEASQPLPHGNITSILAA